MVDARHKISTKQRLWIGGLLLVGCVVLAELFVLLHPHFTVERLFAFHAIYGFLSCVLMVVFAKCLGYLIKRKDNYYDD